MKEKPRSASSSCMDETPRSRASASQLARPASASPSSISEKRRSSSGTVRSIRWPAVGEARRARVAVEADHLGPTLQEGARIAAGAEGPVDHQLTGRGLQRLHHLVEKHGRVRAHDAAPTRVPR
jgi:hypothetical protein